MALSAPLSHRRKLPRRAFLPTRRLPLHGRSSRGSGRWRPEVLAASPARERAGQSEARAALRKVRALEDELDAARRDRQRAEEARDRLAREAAAARAEAGALAGERGAAAQVRALVEDLARASFRSFVRSFNRVLSPSRRGGRLAGAGGEP